MKFRTENWLFNQQPRACVASLNMTNFLGTFTNSNYYDKAYALGPTVEYGKVLSFFQGNQAAYLPLDPNSTAQNSYPNNRDLVERVTAGYGMNTIDIERGATAGRTSAGSYERGCPGLFCGL
jgi:hypothetical protein